MRRITFLLSLILLLLIQPSIASAQIQIGTVKGAVSDPANALLAGAEVTLDNSLTGFHATTVTAPQGEFLFDNVPFGNYTLRVTDAGFAYATWNLSVRSNIPIIINLKLSVAKISESVNIVADEPLVQPDSASTETTLDESFIRIQPGSAGGRQLQNVIATTPGWRTENDGLLHVRGVDDGVLYVVDGVPVTDRQDVTSGNSYDTEMIRSLDVITGSIPAEFGGRSGAIVTVQSKAMMGSPLTGTVGLGTGRFRANEFSGRLGGGRKNLGFLAGVSGNRSDRFLDPVDQGNFNNRGGALRLNLRSDWRPSANDLLLFTFATNGTDFHVTNDLEQELAGQRQRQELRDNSQSVRWQRVWSPTTVSDVAFYRQSYVARLIGSEFDTPLFAAQDRGNTRLGMVAGVTHSFGRHTIKVGMEASRVSLREFFTFAVTDEDEAEEHEISDAALEFDLDDPFVFNGRVTRANFGAYLQDTFTPFKNLSVSAGLRYDHSNLLVSDQQFSPRIGAVYFIEKTKTAIRGSFNRLYMPPQVENLLLASSEEARQLSPFATPSGGGSAVVHPEKVSAYEVGFAQDISGFLKFDAAYWHRSFRNYDDPNVFFNTTIVFPNSVAEGFARGVDARIDVPDVRGWSGYVSYGNARILQTGPINGGLFLTDEFIDITPGTRFVPDHDERNTVSFAVTYNLRSKGLWASFLGRHESGMPLEVDEDSLDELRSRPGADLVNFDRGRVKPWSLFDVSTGFDLFRQERVTVQTQFSVENLANRRFVYNFGNPFSGTHFGYPRRWNGRIRLVFH
jgi:outer membrane receptor protein involved in Fe transport